MIMVCPPLSVMTPSMSVMSEIDMRPVVRNYRNLHKEENIVGRKVQDKTTLSSRAHKQISGARDATRELCA